MKKSKLKNPVLIDDLAALVKMSQTKEWPVFVKMARNRIEYQKDHIIKLPELNPVKLAVDKAYDRGVMAGILFCIKGVETAIARMEELAQKEE